MMNRSESTGLVLAGIGHFALFGLLSVGFLATPNPMNLRSEPIEVSISDEVGLESQAPVPSDEAAALLAPEEGPPVPAAVEPAEAPPEPAAKPEPKPRPAAVPDAKAPSNTKPAPSSAQRPQPRNDRKPTGALEGMDFGATNKPSESKSPNPPAEKAGPAVVSALQAEIYRQLKPHWKPPSGADSEKLRTTVTARLGRDGSIVGEPNAKQSGITPSNRAQAALHKERAIRAVKLAAPFKLPEKFYDAWKTIEPTLYEGL
jgi:outer membrane biosynthesis protein TonB